MSLGNEPGLVDAVRSIIKQDVPVELVVVNSGGGDPEERLQRARITVPVHNERERLTAGAARNIGIEMTQAPIVSFLAADCEATDGWLRNRLKHHDAADAVACAISYDISNGLHDFAYNLYRYGRRTPDSEESTRKLYGVSYRRSIFDDNGVFRDDLHVAEDTEFNDRIRGSVAIEWGPDVITIHRAPRNFLAACSDLHRRVGKRRWFLRATGTNHGRRRIFGEVQYEQGMAKRSLKSVVGISRRDRAILRAMTLTFFAVQLGAILMRRPPEVP